MPPPDQAQFDLDAAAERAMVALDLAESLDSGRQSDLLRDLYRQMKPRARILAVADFLDRARGMVQV
jgi:predicted protein tyrosine phosphatase